MKHGVSTYSYDSLLGNGATYPEIIEIAAKSGFDGVELANLTGNYDYDLSEIKAAAEKWNIECCSWATSSDFIEDREGAISFLKEEIDRAATVGCKLIRTDINHDDRVLDPYAEKTLSAIRIVADYAQSKGMTLVTENHGGYFCLPERLEELCRKVSHPGFGLLCDFANYAAEDVDPVEAVRKTRHLIRHVHMKDCHLLPGERVYPGEGWYDTRSGNYWRCAITGQGNLPMERLLKSLLGGGYDGWLIQEFEGVEDCRYAVKAGLNYVKRALRALPENMYQDTLWEV